MIQFSLLGFDQHGADTEKTIFKYIDNPGIRFIFFNRVYAHIKCYREENSENYPVFLQQTSKMGNRKL